MWFKEYSLIKGYWSFWVPIAHMHRRFDPYDATCMCGAYVDRPRIGSGLVGGLHPSK